MKTAVSDWQERDLSDLIEKIESGQRPYGGVTTESGEIPSLGGENIRQEGGLELSAVRRVPRDFYRSMTKGVLRQQDVLINKDGANTGKAGIYGGEFPAATINEHLFLLRGSPEHMEQRFLYRILISAEGQRTIRRKISGSAQPGLKSDFIRHFPIYVPKELAEQARIATILDVADEAIAKTGAVIAKLKQVRAGLLHDLLTRGLDEHGQLRDPIAHPEQFQDSPLGSIPREWEVLPLEQIANPQAPICYGIVQVLDYIADGIFVLAIRDISGDYLEGIHRTSPGIDASYARSRVQPGDVLVSIKGTIGRIGLVPSHYKGNISRDLARIRLGRRIVPAFLMHLLRSPLGQKRLELAQVGTTRAELSIAPLKRLVFAFPLLGEQEIVTGILNRQDGLIATQEREKEKLDRLRRGLMTDLLAGHVRVTAEFASCPTQ